MDLKNIFWNEENYKKFIKFLFEKEDKKYIEFNKKIIDKNEKFIGVRMPELKKIGKEISKGNWKKFLENCGEEFYEEKILYGLVATNVKIEREERERYLKSFIEKIDNWALCDIVVGNMKFIKKDKENFFEFAKKCCSSKNFWEIRVGLVIFLSYFVEKEHLEDIFSEINKITNEEYYVKMAQAWLISILFVKYREETIKFLSNNNLDSWVQNKGIQKIRESLRVSKEEKEEVLKLKK